MIKKNQKKHRTFAVKGKISPELLQIVVEFSDESGLYNFGQSCSYFATWHCLIVTKYRNSRPIVFFFDGSFREKVRKIHIKKHLRLSFFK